MKRYLFYTLLYVDTADRVRILIHVCDVIEISIILTYPKRRARNWTDGRYGGDSRQNGNDLNVYYVCVFRNISKLITFFFKKKNIFSLPRPGRWPAAACEKLLRVFILFF